MSEELMVSVDDGVMVLTMNRPEAKNAMNRNMAELISGALDTLDADASVGVAVLTGTAGTFCSGMDLKGFLKGEMPVAGDRGFGGIAQYRPQKPVIAAIEGYALAGGFELVLACDLAVASKAAQFGIPEVKRGLVAGAGGLLRLPDQIAPRLAMELALTGDFISADRAYEMGLINAVVPEGQALDGAKKLAARIVANGPLAVATSKRVMYESRGWPHDELWTRQQDLANAVFNSEDAREGATAFAEKRAPVWKGK